MPTEQRTCQNCKQDFAIDQEDFNFYAKVVVPPPTFCPLCRAQRRLAFRNESVLFKRPSDFPGSAGKEIFSAFAPDAPVKVYEKDAWLSDQWDPMDYGQDYDFSKPFFEQLKGLLSEVPLKSLNVVGGANSDYCNNATDPKNSYLCFNGKDSEDCMYCNGFASLKQCVDTSHCSQSEQCYECFWLTSCNACLYSAQCESSYNLMFCRDCVGCHDCFGSVGLRNKEYCIWNEQYTKEEYKKKLEEMDLSSYGHIQDLEKKAREFWARFPRKFIEGYQNTGVSGNYIGHSKNVRDSFLVREGENLRYCQYLQELPGSKDCYDFSIWGHSNQLVHECLGCGIGTNSIKFCYNAQENVRNIEYSLMCMGSSDLFACIGLRKKRYCIFNKQYDETTYRDLVAKIKKHMDEMPYVDAKGCVYKYGEFFPAAMSPFAYNETLAQEYFPKTKEQALAEGYSWREPPERNYATTIKTEDLPDRIGDVSDSIINEVIACAHSGLCNDRCATAFRVTAAELQFYRKMGIPLPRLCPKCRHYERLKQRSLLQMVHKKCQCGGERSESGVYVNTRLHSHEGSHCSNEFETNYQNPAEFLYCEQCYQAEIS
jgi:hypothetical protein